jgi:hypothetical protein
VGRNIFSFWKKKCPLNCPFLKTGGFVFTLQIQSICGLPHGRHKFYPLCVKYQFLSWTETWITSLSGDINPYGYRYPLIFRILKSKNFCFKKTEKIFFSLKSKGNFNENFLLPVQSKNFLLLLKSKNFLHFFRQNFLVLF